VERSGGGGARTAEGLDALLLVGAVGRLVDRQLGAKLLPAPPLRPQDDSAAAALAVTLQRQGGRGDCAVSPVT